MNSMLHQNQGSFQQANIGLQYSLAYETTRRYPTA